MSHGNVTVAVGTCPVCEREAAELTAYVDVSGVQRYKCTDEFACAEAWSRLPSAGSGPRRRMP